MKTTSRLFVPPAVSRARRCAVCIQPVSIAYTGLDGMPLGRGLRPFIAWYGEMSMAPHLWELLGLGKITVEVEFHEPVTYDGFPSRKALSQHCFDLVAKGVSAANAGRARPARSVRARAA